MADLPNHLHREITRVYNSTTNSIKRYNILHELEELIAELRESTVQSFINSEIDESVLIFNKLKIVLSEQAGVTLYEIDEHVKMDGYLEFIQANLGLDSLDQIEFIMALEEYFDTEISDEEIFHLKTVQDVIELVKK